MAIDWPRVTPIALFGFAVVLCGLIVLPMAGTPLGGVDDHEIWALTQGMTPLDLIAADESRFRPLYYLLRGTEAAAFGVDTRWWYLSRFALMLTTVALTAWVAVRYVPAWVGVLAGILVVIGPQAEAWYRLGPQEAYAMPLALAGIGLLVRGRNGLPLLLLAALTKEAFALFALIGLSRRYPIWSAAILTVVAIGGLVWLTQGDVYSSPRTLDPSMLVQLASSTAWPVGLAALVLWRVPVDRRTLGLVALATGPQLALYAGQFQGRYLLPLAVVAAGITTFAIARTRVGLPIAGLTLGLAVVWTAIASQRAETWRAEAIWFANQVERARDTGVRPDFPQAEYDVALDRYLRPASPEGSREPASLCRPLRSPPRSWQCPTSTPSRCIGGTPRMGCVVARP